MQYLRLIIYTGFIGYWLATFLFTMPDNFVNLQYYQQSRVFQFWLFQRWGFFAPPPNFDERLYYEFRNKQTGQLQAFEVLGPICRQKQQKAPFNAHENIVDYLLSSNVSGVADALIQVQQSLPPARQPGKGPADSTLENRVRQYIQQGSHFQTLQQYAGVVADKNELPPDRYEVRMLFSRIMLHKFADRYSRAPRKEETYFVSDYFNVHP